jgi:hypothetical protein
LGYFAKQSFQTNRIQTNRNCCLIIHVHSCPFVLTLNIDFFAYDFPMRQLITDVTQPTDFVGPDLVSGRAYMGGHPGNSRPDTRSGPTCCVTSVNKHSIFGCGYAAPIPEESQRAQSAPSRDTEGTEAIKTSHLPSRAVILSAGRASPTSVPRRCGALRALCDKTDPSNNLPHILPPASTFGCGHATLGPFASIRG